MLQIRNLDDGKSEWNISEAHVIIPMIDGDLISGKDSDKVLASTFTLNPMESGDQAILTNALEHSLVVGLDKNLFETTNYKSDLLIIQNSDLKLLPCNSDLKVAYTLSNVEQDKSEIFWQSPVLKDRICTNDKAILEVKHVLNYEDMDLEKTNDQISLGTISNEIASQALKPEKEGTNQEKNVPDSEFVINYRGEADESKSICILLNGDLPKSVDNVKSTGKKKSLEREANPEINSIDNSFKLGEEFQESVFNVSNHMVMFSDTSPVSATDYGNNKIKIKEKIMTNENPLLEDSNVEGESREGKGMSDSFQEKNLPLKKKAKMKRTITAANSENQKPLHKQNEVDIKEQMKTVPLRKKLKQISNPQQEDPNSSDSEPLINYINSRKKIGAKSSSNNFLVKPQEKKKEEEEMKKADFSGGDETQARKFKSFEFDETKFRNVYDLVESLRKCRIINASVWQILNTGLKEIKIDILKEMNAKRKEKCLLTSSNYSPHLKAFALVLYFKQRAAFNYLSQVYGTGWPSLDVIKQWKRQMNIHQTRNFAKVNSDVENKKS